MFWRKKKVNIDLPDEKTDLRAAFRIRPGSDRPLVLKVAGQSYYLVNISGTGCSFRSSALKQGMIAAGTLTMTSENVVFPVSIKVVYKQRDMCHCEFTKISGSSEEILHAYVLDIQKRQIRKS